MTTDKPNLAEGNAPLMHRQLESHVETPAPVYGEPKGPIPNRLFQHSFASDPPDRERGGFISGRDVVSRGDEVGSGPQEGTELSTPEKDHVSNRSETEDPSPAMDERKA